MWTKAAIAVGRAALLASIALGVFTGSPAMAVTGGNTNGTGGNAGVTGSVSPGNAAKSGNPAAGAGTGGGAAGNLAPGSAGGDPNASPALTPGSHPDVSGKASGAGTKN